MSLEDLLPEFPDMPSEQELQEFRNAHAGDLHAVTVCECGNMQYAHRLGCRCAGKIKWLYLDNSGSLLECGVDFSPLPN